MSRPYQLKKSKGHVYLTPQDRKRLMEALYCWTDNFSADTCNGENEAVECLQLFFKLGGTESLRHELGD